MNILSAYRLEADGISGGGSGLPLPKLWEDL